MSQWHNNIDKNPQIRDDLQYVYKYNANNLVEYVLVSKPWNVREGRKTRLSDYLWQIVKFIYDGNNNVIEKIFANGNNDFVHKADDYDALEYIIDG